MKTEKCRDVIIQTLQKKTTVTAKEINDANKEIAYVQIFGVMSKLVKNGSVQLNEESGKKSYTLIDAEKLNNEPSENSKSKSEKISKVAADKSEKPKQKTGRDLSTYKFNGKEYNKGRLAHAIVLEASKKLTLKSALTLFEDSIVPPYGVIKQIKEAKEMSKNRARFFIKNEEIIKLKDGTQIAVSNQWTPDRIARIITIARKELKLIIK